MVKARVALSVALIAVAAAAYWWLHASGTLEVITERERLKAWAQDLGAWGPVLMVALMIAAIVMSPIPSGPIAMVAGAAFGPALGTVYVAFGATVGAMIAFLIARTLGYEVVARWPKSQKLLGHLEAKRSQNWLMVIVFLSRLVPFISFDAVSYVAGLTPLAFWRFALATIAGVLPISFVLAYFGQEVLSADSPYAVGAAVLIGGITLAPLLWRLLRRRGGTATGDAEQDARPEGLRETTGEETS